MKTIRVFLASSSELDEERKEFGFLFCHLNRIFRPRGIYIELVPWEFLDSSMGLSHKQQEYNKELESCEVCIVLYWTKFGEYTYEEFSYAYERLKQGYNPRKLYVFFKEPGNISRELQEFKDRFDKDYGHFYCKFSNVATLKFEFLVQLETYQNTNLLNIENSIIKYDDIEVAHTSNLPFIGNDTQFQNLVSEIEVINDRISLLAELYEAAPNEDRRHRLEEAKFEKEKLLEKLSRHEQGMINNALQIAKMTTIRVNRFANEAITAFNNGNISKANSILKTFENEVDTTIINYNHASALLKQQTQNGQILLETLLLTASFLFSDSTIPLNERTNKVDKCYRKAITLANLFNMAPSKRYSILLTYTSFLIDNAMYDTALKNCKKLEHLCSEDPSEKGRLYNIWGGIHDALYQHRQAQELYTKAYVILSGTNNIIESYNALTNLGSVMFSQNKHTESLEYYMKAFSTINNNASIPKVLLAKCHTNIGAAYDAIGNGGDAVRYHYNALELYNEIYDSPHINIAVCHNNIGSALLKAEPFESLNHFHKALQICNELKGYYHPTTSVCYMNMGHGYEYISEYEDSLYCYSEALKIRRKIYGDRHEIIAQTLLNVGIAYYFSGDHENALRSYETAADIYRIYGKEHCAMQHIHHLKNLTVPPNTFPTEELLSVSGEDISA